MKIKLHFKTSDAVYYALKDADFENDDQREVVAEALAHWVKYGECVTLVYDTNDETIEVAQTR